MEIVAKILNAVSAVFALAAIFIAWRWPVQDPPTWGLAPPNAGEISLQWLKENPKRVRLNHTAVFLTALAVVLQAIASLVT